MKKLIELTLEEAEELFRKNDFLRKKCEECAEEDASFNLEELFRPFCNVTGLEWNIGYPGNYVTARYNLDYEAFFDGILNNDFCGILDSETENLVKRASEKVEFYRDCTCGYIDISDKKFEQFEKWFDNAVEKACAGLADFAIKIYDYGFSEEAALEALEAVIDTDAYETDGTFIYETEVRKYA